MTKHKQLKAARRRKRVARERQASRHSSRSQYPELEAKPQSPKPQSPKPLDTGYTTFEAQSSEEGILDQEA